MNMMKTKKVYNNKYLGFSNMMTEEKDIYLTKIITVTLFSGRVKIKSEK